MQGRLFSFSGLILAVIFVFSGTRALAIPAISLTATNVTMTPNGSGYSDYTVSNIPDCPITTVGTPVTAGQTLTGTMEFYAFDAVPGGVQGNARRSGELSAAGLAMAGCLVLGFGLRRRARRWLALSAIAMGALAALAGINACGGITNKGIEPGTYKYAITANYVDTPHPNNGAILEANINVVVE
ncbi:MAG: hypothetical protein ABR906_00750 [Terracidiphilus sp.]|jgi:hypothetical protein